MMPLARCLRLAGAAWSAALLLAPLPALAQDAALPPLAQPEAAQPAAAPAEADPPARVGRVASIDGTVSFHGPDAEAWQAATPNFPLTAGDALWTQPQSSAVAEVSDSRITLAGETELDVDAISDLAMTATEPKGEIFLDLRDLAAGETYTLRTPRAVLTLAQAGRYAVAAGDTATPTTITVVAGAAQVNGADLHIMVQPGQTLTITGDTNFTGSIGPAQRDPFLVAMLEQRPPAPPPAAAPPPAEIAQMPGAEDLQAYGSWQPTPQYGSVWYPQVAPGWVPYREGHWAYVVPWGWTWVDNAPWGFAPFHYGRWVTIGGRWAWTPAYAAAGGPAPAFGRPVYAPALVSFLGGGGGAVGWVPLGWNEPFHPYYRTSPGYLRNVNRGSVANVNAIGRANAMPIDRFANRGAATSVPAAAMVGSRPIAAEARPVPAQQLAAMRPAAIPPVRPSRATAGVTPAVARQLGLPPGAQARPSAPGPALTPAANRTPQARVKLRAPTAKAASVPAHPQAAPAPAPAHGPETPAAKAEQHPAIAPHPATPAHGPEAPAAREVAHPAAVPAHEPAKPAHQPEAHPAIAPHPAAPAHEPATPAAREVPHPAAVPAHEPAKPAHQPEAHPAAAPHPAAPAHESATPAAREVPHPAAVPAHEPAKVEPHPAPHAAPPAHPPPKPAQEEQRHCNPDQHC